MTISLDERIDNKLMSLRLQIKEINKNLQDMAKVSLEVNHSNTFIERIQKMVDLKLESYTYSVDQKLINISLQTGNVEVPAESFEGKQILYKAGNEFVDPKLIQPSIDGTFWIKRENILEESQRGQSTNDNNPMNLDKKSCKCTKYTKAENSQKRELKKNAGMTAIALKRTVPLCTLKKLVVDSKIAKNPSVNEDTTQKEVRSCTNLSKLQTIPKD